MEHGGRYIISSWIEDCGSPATLVDNGTTNEVVAAYTYFFFLLQSLITKSCVTNIRTYIYIPKILEHNPRPWRWVWNTPRHWLGKPYRWLVLSEHMLPNKRCLTKTVWFLQPFSVPPFLHASLLRSRDYSAPLSLYAYTNSRVRVYVRIGSLWPSYWSKAIHSIPTQEFRSFMLGAF